LRLNNKKTKIMKRIFILVAFVFVSTIAFAQKNKEHAAAIDTLQGSETVQFTIVDLQAPHDMLTITALCEQLGGTSDGTLALYGSTNNTDWVFINGVGAGVLTASPKASITGADLNQVTITDALVANWVVKDLPYIYYKLTGVGTTGDTTKITPTYRYN